jgi:hypothetical protein
MQIFIILMLILSLAACKSRSTGSDIKITNGVTENGYPAVVELGRDCTATMIATDVALTAGHCVWDASQYSIVLNGKRFVSNTKLIHPLFDGTLGTEQYDLALLKFSVGANSPVIRLSSSPLENKSDVKLIGFGQDNHQKNSGTNRFNDYNRFFPWNFYTSADSYRKSGIIIIDGEIGATSRSYKPGENSSTSGGDSGSPLLASNKVTAVLSNGEVVGRISKTNRSYYVDLHSKSSLGFFSYAETQKGFKLKGSCCSCKQAVYSSSKKLNQKTAIIKTGGFNGSNSCNALNGVKSYLSPGGRSARSGSMQYHLYSACSSTACGG